MLSIHDESGKCKDFFDIFAFFPIQRHRRCFFYIILLPSNPFHQSHYRRKNIRSQIKAERHKQRITDDRHAVLFLVFIIVQDLRPAFPLTPRTGKNALPHRNAPENCRIPRREALSWPLNGISSNYFSKFLSLFPISLLSTR